MSEQSKITPSSNSTARLMKLSEPPQSGNGFDETSVRGLLTEIGLELVQGFSIADLLSQLNDVAYEHYWNELIPQNTRIGGQILSFDALANSSVPPSRLLDRLVGIEKSAKRIVAGRSRRPPEHALPGEPGDGCAVQNFQPLRGLGIAARWLEPLPPRLQVSGENARAIFGSHRARQTGPNSH